MQSDKRGRAERLFVLEAAVKTRSGTGPRRCDCWAEPMMQRKFSGLAPGVACDAPLNDRSPQNSPNPFRQGSKLVLFETGPHSKTRGLGRCGIWVCIVSGSRNGYATELSLFGQKGRQGLDSDVARDTEQYLLKYLIWVSTSLRTRMRGKSARVGSGFVARVSEKSFASVSIAD
jgi:hypothetical protein